MTDLLIAAILWCNTTVYNVDVHKEKIDRAVCVRAARYCILENLNFKVVRECLK